MGPLGLGALSQYHLLCHYRSQILTQNQGISHGKFYNKPKKELVPYSIMHHALHLAGHQTSSGLS